MSPHYLVIGSGPSGTAAAAALLDAGAQVTLVDIGADLTTEAQARVDTLARQAEWPAADRAWIQRGLKADTGGVPLKTLFGEDFMYARHDVAGSPRDFGHWPSRSLGGLSRVWGATLKRFGPRQLGGWPVSAEELTPHYAAAENLLGPHGAILSAQGKGLLQQWSAHGDELAGLGATVAPASLAVSPDCKLCGMCLYGCPYGYIFSSADLVRRFQSH